MSYTASGLKQAIAKNPNEPEFHQAVTEILTTLQPYVDSRPEYEKVGILERMVEPERVIMFREPWVDDNGKTRVTAALAAAKGIEEKIKQTSENIYSLQEYHNAKGSSVSVTDAP